MAPLEVPPAEEARAAELCKTNASEIAFTPMAPCLFRLLHLPLRLAHRLVEYGGVCLYDDCYATLLLARLGRPIQNQVGRKNRLGWNP